MKKGGIILIFALVICLLTSADVWAQATAQISGTVKDQTGALLPGVEIKATQAATGIERSTVTNETGAYTLTNLVTGTYNLEAMLPGFRSHVQSGIVLQVGSEPAIHIVLQVGEVTETIEVQAQAAAVETRTVGVSQVMETQRILELPLNGREVESLIGLSGASVYVGTTSNRSIGGQRYSVAGGVDFGVEYQLDGANHMNYTSSVGNILPFPDAL